MALVSFTNKGIYCNQGDFYIDPWRPVKYAVTTHGHADHVRFGNEKYLCTPLTSTIVKTRISPELNVQEMDFGDSLLHNGVKISFHPAGHILGSAQVRLEYKHEVCVISGDYKTENDHLSGQFEPVKCDHFITESTFGLPVYNWKPQEVIFSDISNWIKSNIISGKTSILIAYSLGKAQRLIHGLANEHKMYVHSSIDNLNQALIGSGVSLPFSARITPEITKQEMQTGVVIVPPVIRTSKWIKTLQSPVVGICSGWMQVRAHRRWQSADAGFALSDHADWNGLLSAIKSTEAKKVSVTHGFTYAFSKQLNEIGIEAEEVVTEYGEEDDESGAKPEPVNKITEEED